MNKGNVDVLVGDYPDPWINDYHEVDGGEDARAIRPQNGVEILEGDERPLLSRWLRNPLG